MTETHVKKCSISFVFREMKIKMTLRFHLTPDRMAKIKISGDSTCCQGCGERRTLLNCWWEYKLVQPLWKSICQFLRKLEIGLPEDPATPLLHIYPKDVQPYHKDILFIADLFIIARNWKQARHPSIKEWIKKMWYIYTVQCYSAIKNKDIMNLQANGWDFKISWLR